MPRRRPPPPPFVAAADAALALLNRAPLAGRPVGLLGLPRPALAAAFALRARGCPVLAVDVVERAEAVAVGVRYTSVHDLFASADVVLLFAPRLPATVGAVDAHVLRDARPGLVLVGVEPAGVVDAAALARAVDDGIVAAAVAVEPPGARPGAAWAALCERGAVLLAARPDPAHPPEPLPPPPTPPARSPARSPGASPPPAPPSPPLASVASPRRRPLRAESPLPSPAPPRATAAISVPVPQAAPPDTPPASPPLASVASPLRRPLRLPVPPVPFVPRRRPRRPARPLAPAAPAFCRDDDTAPAMAALALR